MLWCRDSKEPKILSLRSLCLAHLKQRRCYLLISTFYVMLNTEKRQVQSINELKEKQVINLQVTDGLTVAVIQNQTYEFLMLSKDVGLGYGVSAGNIRNQMFRNQDDFIEGRHFVKGVSLTNTLPNTQPNAIFWTKAGIVRLGFFIKSERAKIFRDWAESVILKAITPELPKNLPAIAKRKHNRLTQDRMVSILADVCRIEDSKLRLSLIQKLGV